MVSVIVQAQSPDASNLLDNAEGMLLVDSSKALELIAEAEKGINTDTPSAIKARALNLRAHSHILNHSLEKAFSLADSAQIEAEQVGAELQRAEAIRKKGIIYFLLDLYADAFEHLTQSLSIHLALDSRYVLNNLQSIGNLYTLRDAWADNLIDIGKQLLAQAQAKNSKAFEVDGYSFVASGLIKKAKYPEAKQVLQAGFDALGSQGNELKFYLAEAEWHLGNYSIALDALNHSLGHVNDSPSVLGVIAHKLLKAKIMLDLPDKQEQAITLLQEVQQQAADIGFAEYRLSALKLLSEFYRSQSKYQQALAYFEQFNALSESTFNAKQAEQLAFKRAQLGVVEKNQQIKSLELSAQLATQENRLQLYVILLSSIIIALLLVLVVRSSAQKRALREYSSQLKRASKAKSEFLARMSHEIRTPLNAVIGLTQLSRNDKHSDPQGLATNLRQIEESSQSLLAVINDILDFSKIEAGKLTVEATKFDLSELLDRTMRLHALNAGNKGLAFSQVIASDVPLRLVGDALRIQQVLNNLLSNGIKFTDHGAVFVNVSLKNDAQGARLIEFRVQDTGIGLTPEQIDGLFKSFSQADESITRRFGGTGLGLAICKQLVELMGGHIQVESQPNRGAAFSFALPLAQADEDLSVLADTDMGGIKVLVADSLAHARQSVIESLKRIQVSADLAESLSDAIVKVSHAAQGQKAYDVLMIDAEMLGENSLDAFNMAQGEVVQPTPKLILLASQGQKYSDEVMQSSGIFAVLNKPTSTREVLNTFHLIEQDSLSQSKSATPEPNTQSTKSNRPDFSGKRILLVEDYELNRKVAKGFLAYTNADVSVAENGEAAVKMLAHENRYDLILMDIQMPVMDGLTATRKIRHELGLTLPIIAMTANALKEDVDKSIAAGMNMHVSKPVNPDELFRCMSLLMLSGHESIGSVDAGAGLGIGAGTALSPNDISTSDLLHIDPSKALTALSHDEVLYQEVVQDFLNMAEPLEHFHVAIKKRDLNSIKVCVHAFQSALAYIGAFNLAQESEALEALIVNRTQRKASLTLNEIDRTKVLADSIKRVMSKVGD